MSTTESARHAEAPAWAYIVGGMVYVVTAFVALPYTLNYILSPLSIAVIILIVFHITFLGARFYFTFRSRLIHHFGLAPTHSQAWINEFAEINTRVLAVGAPAFREAPLAGAWAGLTGRERAQTGGQRTIILALVIIAVALLESCTIAIMMFPGLALVFLYSGESTLSYILCGLIMIATSIGLMAAGLITQSGIRRCQHLADRFGYRWADKHPILRGFTDQLLATYHIPNPTRDRELQDDAALGARAVSV